MINKISKVTRTDILLGFIAEHIDIETILSKILNFQDQPSYEELDGNLYIDWIVHRVHSSHWENDRFIKDERLNILNIPDSKFLNILSTIVNHHIKNKDLISFINSKLERDGFELILTLTDKGKGLYKGQNIGGKKKVNIQFYSSIYSTYNQNYILPCIILVKTKWDDYGFKTTYKAYFYSEDGSEEEIGEVKILQNGVLSTNLPKDFIQLPDNTCSLFQSKETYRKLLSSKIRKYNILHQLNDLTIRKDILLNLGKSAGVQESLTREIEAYTISKGLINNSNDASFDFINNSLDIPYKIKFNFKYHKILPYRINTLIGKNGSGKTRTLSTIASTLVNYTENNNASYYDYQRPNFAKIITISYSAFDSFLIPEEDETSYQYCGLKNKKNRIDIKLLEKNLLLAVKDIKKKSQEQLWKNFLKELFEHNENIEINNIKTLYSILSSGQKILITIFSEILANIENKSLLLFDEPENHLHPNMIFKLIKVMNEILDIYDSYLIIGTHSPIIIQQIPAEYIHILNKNSEKIIINKLSMESFGENFSTITKEVFGKYEEDDILYKDLFDKLSKKYSKKEIENAFNNSLSMNAQIYLETIFSNKHKGEK